MTVAEIIRYVRSNDSRWDGPLRRVALTWMKRLNFVRRYDIKMMTPRLNVQPDDVIADVGCASGYWTAHFGRRCRSAVGVDVDAASIADANELHRAPNIRFAVADAEALPLEDASCDKVLSVSVFQFVPQREQAIAEVARVLKPGGTFVMTVDSLDASGLDDEYRRMHCRAFGVVHLFDETGLRGLLEAGGLVIDEVRPLIRSRLGSWLVRITTLLGRLSYLAFPIAYPLLLLAEAGGSRKSGGHKLLAAAHKPTECGGGGRSDGV